MFFVNLCDGYKSAFCEVYYFEFLIGFDAQGAREVEEDLLAIYYPGLLVHGVTRARWTVQEMVLPWQAQGTQIQEMSKVRHL